jgi:hypothetical protein
MEKYSLHPIARKPSFPAFERDTKIQRADLHFFHRVDVPFEASFDVFVDLVKHSPVLRELTTGWKHHTVDSGGMNYLFAMRPLDRLEYLDYWGDLHALDDAQMMAFRDARARGAIGGVEYGDNLKTVVVKGNYWDELVSIAHSTIFGIR